MDEIQDTSLGRGMAVILIAEIGIKAGLDRPIRTKATRTEMSTESPTSTLDEDATSKATTGVPFIREADPYRDPDLDPQHEIVPGRDRFPARRLDDVEDPTQATRLRQDEQGIEIIPLPRQLVVAGLPDEGIAQDPGRRLDL